MEEAEILAGKTIQWAGVVTNRVTGDAEFVVRFADDTTCTVGAWQTEGHPIEMNWAVTPSEISPVK